jgi:hypothetical protein
VADERQIPVYAVEFKAPHKVTIPELVAGLHQMDLARDVIDQEGDTFEFYATRLVAAVVTQIFSYMIDSGVRYGYICTGEAFVFLHIPEGDPTIVQYFLCIPNQDVPTLGDSVVSAPSDHGFRGKCVLPFWLCHLTGYCGGGAETLCAWCLLGPSGRTQSTII